MELTIFTLSLVILWTIVGIGFNVVLLKRIRGLYDGINTLIESINNDLINSLGDAIQDETRKQDERIRKQIERAKPDIPVQIQDSPEKGRSLGPFMR